VTRKKLLMFGGPVLLLLVVGAVYKLVLAPAPVVEKKKIEGTLYTLPNEFVLNLSGGQYAKVTVAVELSGAAAAAEASAAAVALPQEAAVRAIVTDTLTDMPSTALTNRAQRQKLEKTLLKAVQHGTDEPVVEVLLTDIAVQ
jgi:flagellar basal body-associated protein FliL